MFVKVPLLSFPPGLQVEELSPKSNISKEWILCCYCNLCIIQNFQLSSSYQFVASLYTKKRLSTFFNLKVGQEIKAERFFSFDIHTDLELTSTSLYPVTRSWLSFTYIWSTYSRILHFALVDTDKRNSINLFHSQKNEEDERIILYKIYFYYNKMNLIKLSFKDISGKLEFSFFWQKKN